MATGNQEEARLWGYLRDCCLFVHVTGQVYRFEDALKSRVPGEPAEASVELKTDKSPLSRMAADLLINTLKQTSEPENKQHVWVLMALLNFITNTGQADEVEDFFTHRHEYAHLAIRHFATQSEAEEWSNTATELPSPAHILIGDQYWQFWYERKGNIRFMYRDYANEPTIAMLAEKGVPPGAPAFKTRAEAEEWLKGPPAASEVFVLIGGEHYFAEYQKRLKRHTLHHVATALKEWEEYKQAHEREKAQAAVNLPETGDNKAPEDGSD